MNNPFEKRAGEYFRDDESFLAVVSPEPLSIYLKPFAQSDRLYGRLVLMRGAPGSGKTTIAQLFEYHRIATLLRHIDNQAYRALLAALADCGAVVDGQPTLVACRIPMESGYRDIWEFPYPDDLKTKLLTSLIQARAVLGWLRNLEKAGVALAQVRIVPRDTDTAAIQAIGGVEGSAVLQRAQEVEHELYSISAALIAPPLEEIRRGIIGAFHPFDIVDSIEIHMGGADHEPAAQTTRLRPLVILDDAQTLHPSQFSALQMWLTRRELTIGRWVLSWLDVIPAEEALRAGRDSDADHPDQPGIDPDRIVTRIYLQSGYTDRRHERRSFRKTAKDIANRYLLQMPIFANRNIQRFEDLLEESVEPLSRTKTDELTSQLGREQRELGVSSQRRELLKEEVERYAASTTSRDVTPDLRLAMLRILMHRYANRTPQADLFDEEDDPEPNKPLRADSAVADGARFHLMHMFDRPYYYGIDDLCDAGTENIEQFLRLAAALVDRATTQLTRGKRASLSAATQHEELRRRARRMLARWSFPGHEGVRGLVESMASRCISASLMPNAWLGAGANAFGVRQEEFDQVHRVDQALARLLQLGVAYNAFTLVPEYNCKGQLWCLIELGGVPSLHHGLTLKRGGFIESTVGGLGAMMRPKHTVRPTVA